MRCGNAFGHVCLSVCLSVMLYNFRKPWPRRFFLVCMCFFRIYRPVYISRSQGVARVGTSGVCPPIVDWVDFAAGELKLWERRLKKGRQHFWEKSAPSELLCPQCKIMATRLQGHRVKVVVTGAKRAATRYCDFDCADTVVLSLCKCSDNKSISFQGRF